MTWFFIALIAPALWAAVNYIDEYLIKERSLSPMILSIFSGIVGSLLVLLFIFFFHFDSIVPMSIVETVILLISGFSIFLFVLYNLYALEESEASVVSPLFLLSVIFGYILGIIFLSELLETKRILGGALVMLGSYIIVGKSQKKLIGAIKLRVLWFMVLSSFFAALSSVAFRYVAEPKGDSFLWTTTFWQHIGFLLITLLLIGYNIVIRGQKAGQVNMKEIWSSGFIGVTANLANETLTIIGNVALNYALIFAPAALVITVTEGFQPFFVLFYGFLLAKLAPKIFGANGRRVKQKTVAIFVMCVGTVLILL